MRRATLATVVAALVCTAAGVDAQGAAVSPQCQLGGVIQLATQDACQKSIDLFQFLAPQLGVIITGGNAVLGEPGALRGPGHFSLGLRVNAVRGYLPRIDRVTPSVTGAKPSLYETRRQTIPMPTADVAIGVFRGIPFAGSHALAIDGLVNIAYLPEVDDDDLAVSIPDGSVKLGYGLRVALLQETFATPAITVSYLRRDLPVVDVVGRLTSDTLSVRDLDVGTSAFRAVVGKSLYLFGLSAGYGVDRYESSALVSVSIHRAGQAFTSSPIDVRQKLTRRNYFVDASFNLPVLKVVGEIGRATGGTITTFNTFEGRRADDPLTYASLGVRLAW
jgi:hypothetical protein